MRRHFHPGPLLPESAPGKALQQSLQAAPEDGLQVGIGPEKRCQRCLLRVSLSRSLKFLASTSTCEHGSAALSTVDLATSDSAGSIHSQDHLHPKSRTGSHRIELESVQEELPLCTTPGRSALARGLQALPKGDWSTTEAIHFS